MPKAKPTTVSQYIDAAPKQAREKLREIRAILREAAPTATETLKWGTPVFEEKRILFAFAAFKSHLGFMPTPAAMEPFREELAKFKTGKGSIQFPYDQPLPEAHQPDRGVSGQGGERTRRPMDVASQGYAAFSVPAGSMRVACCAGTRQAT